MSTYLVTGGAGFIGSSLVERLLRLGETVRVIDDFSSGRRANLANLEGRLEVTEGSIVDAEVVAGCMRGVDVVFHEAAIPSVSRSVENPARSLLANVQGTTVVLDAARHAGVKRLVFAASSSAYGDTAVLPKVETMEARPLSPYAISKATGEQLVRVFASLYGIETVSLRYFNVFGPRQDPASQYAAVIPKFIMAALRKEPPTIFGDGEQTRDFCFIDNVVEANLLAAGSSKKLTGQVVNIACGDRTSLNQLWSAVGEETSFSATPRFEPTRPGDVRDSLADIRAAADLIGYEPKVRLRAGLSRTLAALRTAQLPA
jgi:nucleoside-diphosphate-sugar epimerase